MHDYTVVFGTYNEERRIEYALRNVFGKAEIVIVDNFSSDRTLEIAARYTDRIFQQKNIGYWDRSTYECMLANTPTDWMLIRGCGEMIPQRLHDTFVHTIQQGRYRAVLPARKSISNGVWTHRPRTYPFTNQQRISPHAIRYCAPFAHKDAFDFSQTRIHHETVLNIPYEQIYILPVEDDLMIWQFRDYDAEASVRAMNAYGSIEARERFSDGERVRPSRILWRSFRRFLAEYLTGQGYRSGMIGFCNSMWLAQMEFNTLLKIWEQQEGVTLAHVRELHRQLKEEIFGGTFVESPVLETPSAGGEPVAAAIALPGEQYPRGT
ncbi:MAG TPA: glycosyltransferase [Armatimonadota bacterium]|jgi:hypothetical protein